jgi:hypothetical protein
MIHNIGEGGYKIRIPLWEKHDSCEYTEYKDIFLTKDELKQIRKQIKELKIEGID